MIRLALILSTVLLVFMVGATLVSPLVLPVLRPAQTGGALGDGGKLEVVELPDGWYLNYRLVNLSGQKSLYRITYRLAGNDLAQNVILTPNEAYEYSLTLGPRPDDDDAVKVLVTRGVDNTPFEDLSIHLREIEQAHRLG